MSRKDCPLHENGESDYNEFMIKRSEKLENEVSLFVGISLTLESFLTGLSEKTILLDSLDSVKEAKRCGLDALYH